MERPRKFVAARHDEAERCAEPTVLSDLKRQNFGCFLEPELVGTACALHLVVNNKTRWLGVLFGAAALSGLTYTVARRSSLKRTAESPVNKRAVELASDARRITRDWESIGSAGPNLREPLDLALNLGGVFDAAAYDEPELTARPSDHVPPPVGGDDEDAPSADDLGRNWLTQATQSERSLSELDLAVDVDNIAKPADEDEIASVDDEDQIANVDDEIGNDDLGELDEHHPRA